MTKSQNEEVNKSRSIKPIVLAARWFICSFRSIKFAIFLILILSLLSLIGALMPQVPAEIAVDRAGYTWWLENVAYYRFGSWTEILSFLGFFNIFHSFLFLIAGSLLMINIIICSLSRIGLLKSKLSKTKIIQNESFYYHGKHHTELVGKIPYVENVDLYLTKILKRYHYTSNKRKNDNGTYLAGDKNRFSVIGTYAVHLSIILFVLAFILSSYMGFRNSSFIIAENTIRNIGYNTGLSLSLESFTDEYWNDGTPKDYRSDVILFENGKEVKRGIVRVNHPLIYKGIRFHQSFFGPAVRIRITGSENTTLFEGNIALPEIRISRPFQRPEGGFKLSGTDYSLAIIGSALNKVDPLIGQDEIGLELYKNSEIPIAWIKLELGIPQEIEGMEFTFLKNTKYSGFQISRDPGSNIIWTASFLFLAGLITVLYFPFGRVWIAAYTVSSGKKRLLIKMESGKKIHIGIEFKRLINDIKTDLGLGEVMKE